MSDEKCKQVAIKVVVILIAVIAFAIYSRVEDARQEREYRALWRELNKGYSAEDWRRSSYYGGSSGTSKTYTPSSERSTTTRNKSRTIKKHVPTDSDSLNVKDYRDPEDFYEDHYDDFFDYEDAEDYYREHGGF